MARQPGGAVARAVSPERCRFEGWQAPGAPRVWALPLPPATPRDAQRTLARQALAALLGVGPLTNQRGEPPRAPQRPSWHLSLSHAEGVSLLACHSAPVGVDVQALPVLADTATAQLFLGPNWPLRYGFKPLDAIDSGAFASAWTQHEARLKCAGLPLQEWSKALAARLAPWCAAPVPLPGYAAALAWGPQQAAACR